MMGVSEKFTLFGFVGLIVIILLQGITLDRRADQLEAATKQGEYLQAALKEQAETTQRFIEQYEYMNEVLDERQVYENQLKQQLGTAQLRVKQAVKANPVVYDWASSSIPDDVRSVLRDAENAGNSSNGLRVSTKNAIK